jgi:hypothetical protein
VDGRIAGFVKVLAAFDQPNRDQVFEALAKQAAQTTIEN